MRRKPIGEEKASGYVNAFNFRRLYASTLRFPYRLNEHFEWGPGYNLDKKLLPVGPHEENLFAAWALNLLGTRRTYPVSDDERGEAGRNERGALHITYLAGTRAWLFHDDLVERFRVAIEQSGIGPQRGWCTRFQSRYKQLEIVVQQMSTDPPEPGRRGQAEMPLTIVGWVI